MPLDNTASVKDIITSLEDMQGINTKADLASVVGIPASADDSMAMITNTIQQAKNELASKTDQDNTDPLQSLVDNMVVGKKWASGVTTSFLSDGNGFISVNLPFKPSIFVASRNGTGNNVILYIASIYGESNYSFGNSAGTAIIRPVTQNGGYINDSTVRLFASSYDETWSWDAIE